MTCTLQTRHTAQTSSMDGVMKKIMALQAVMHRIRHGEELYVVMSASTHMPFVSCNPKTYDDEIFLYFGKDEAVKGAQWFLAKKHPIQLAGIDKKSRLSFFSSLFSMGVNAVTVSKSLPGEMVIQLNQLVSRQNPEKLSKRARVENPELHLTSLYFAQELAKKGKTDPDAGMPEELKTLDEELAAHFRRARYIIAVDEDGGGIPLVRKNGNNYQPVFTDMREFQKFNRERKYSVSLLEYDTLREILSPGTAGVVINPFGADVLLRVDE